MGPGGRVGRLTPGTARRAARAVTVSGLVGAILLAPVQICPFALIFHAPCPGCGLTRAAVALLSGNVERAAALHPLSLVLVPLVGAILGTQVWRYVARGEFWAGAPRSWWWVELGAITLVAAILGVWVARFFGCFGGPVAV